MPSVPDAAVLATYDPRSPRLLPSDAHSATNIFLYGLATMLTVWPVSPCLTNLTDDNYQQV